MPQYTMHSKHASVIAIDQHARSVTMQGIDLASAEIKSKCLINCPSAVQIVEWAAAWATPPYRFAYESGPCGFQLAREIRALGHDCDVIAVTSIARSSEDKYLKDDRRDAARLLTEMLTPMPKIKTVWIPDEECEAARDLVRTYYDAMAAAKRSKLQLSGFLLRHGHVWNERTKRGKLKKTWTPGYVKWVQGIQLPEQAAMTTLTQYFRFASENIDRAKRLAGLCLEVATGQRFKPYVDALTRLKGTEPITAFTFTVTMGDFKRFKNGRSVSAYFGMVPKRHDSGERTGKNGHVTKAGDTTVRLAVIEALTPLPNFTRGAKVLKGDATECSPKIEAEALKCNLRSIERYRHLIDCGKAANVAKVAVASEVVRDMWVIGCMVQEGIA